MKDFEAFKASRQARDPSTRGYSKYQWEKAYAAYQRARGAASAGPASGSVPAAAAGLEPELQRVRAHTAYAQTRLLIQFLFWAVVVLVLLAALLRAGIAIAMDEAWLLLLPSALFNGALQIVVAIALRLIAEAVVDLPDIALHRSVRDSARQVPPADGPGAAGISTSADR